MLIGVDHGNKQIKTVHCNPFAVSYTHLDVYKRQPRS